MLHFAGAFRFVVVIAFLTGFFPFRPGFGIVTEAVAGGPRLSATVSEPFEFQGRVFPAGPVSVRPMADYNPSASIDQVWIGDECLGMMVADRHPASKPSRHDAVLLERSAGGRLVLVGYVLRDQEQNSTFRYRSPAAIVTRGPAAPAGDGPTTVAAR